MVPPEFQNRELPSVNDRRLRKGNVLQWFFVVAIFVTVAFGVVWFASTVKSSMHRDPQEGAGFNEPKPAAPEKLFAFPALPVPVKPPSQAAASTPVAASATVPAPTVARPTKPEPQAGDLMMLNSPAPQLGSSRLSGDGRDGAARMLASAGSATQEGLAKDSGALAAMLQPTHTARVHASLLGNSNFILARGTIFDCILNTRLNSTVSGMVSCTVPRNVYSESGKIVLVERGSVVTGEYTSNLQRGRERIFVLWDRIRTTNGVIIDINSPATDALGEAGVGGEIDNHWTQRIGASVLLSLVQDAVQYATSVKSSSSGGVVVLPNTTQDAQSLSGKVLDSTINIPPTLTREEGARVNVFMARDLDFSNVYKLHPE